MNTFTTLSALIMQAIGTVASIRWMITHNPWKTSAKTPDESFYQEVVAIKDRLYKDMVRLESLQGTEMASGNIRQIIEDLGL